jgi:hypothetical protein
VAPEVIVGLMIAMGAVLCFFGYRAFRGVLVVAGFVLGFVFTFDAIVTFFHHRYAAFFVALVVGVVLGALSTRVYLVGVFVVAALFGVALALHFYAIGAEKPEPAMLFMFGAVAGIAAVYFQKVAIIAVTALAGAWGVVAGVANFATSLLNPLNLRSIERFAHADNLAIAIVSASWLVLAAAGIAYQSRSRSAPEAAPKKSRDAADAPTGNGSEGRASSA